jgi:cytosine/uracil/thiamine/allantoin permease
VSVVGDVVHIASRLSWWGALLTGILSYILIAIVLGGYIEGHIAAQTGSKFHALTEARFGRLVHVCNWVGIACFIAGLFFAVRNYFISKQARSSEKGIVTILSKLIGRSID